MVVKVYLPVYPLVVALTAYNFRSKVIWSAAKRPGDVWYLLREAEIGDFDVSVSVEQQVLGLQVSVDDVHAVEVVECERDFSSVEFGYRVWEPLKTS